MKSIRIATALCALGLFGQALAEVTMTATPSKTGNVVSSVSLAFGGVAAEGEYALFVAYGATDAGDDIRSWEKYEKVADVDAGTASHVYASMPADWGFKYHAMRFFLFDKNAEKPFDRALEYVEATGTQYVLTDFTPTGSSVLEADIEMSTASSSWETLFCARKYNGVNPFALLKSGGSLRFDYFSHNNGTGLFATFSDGRMCIRCSASGLCVDRRLQDGPVEAVTTEAGEPLALFALRTSAGYGYLGKAKLYGLRVWADATAGASPALDLVPCATNGVACLYDRVSKKFYGPTGGDLVASAEDGFYFTDAAAAQTPVVNDVESMAVAATMNAGGTISASFQALPGACKLFAAYSDHDCGDDMQDWDNTVFVGNLSAGATSYPNWTPPQGWGTAFHYLRFFLVDMSKAPCDRQFDYIRGQGAQYISLSDVTPTGRSSIVVDAAFDEGDTVNHGIWSGRASGAAYLFLFHGNAHTWRWDYRSSYDNISGSYGRHVLSMDANVFSCDGEPIFTAPITNKNSFGTSLVVFALNSGETISTYGKFSLYSFRIWSNKTFSGEADYGQAVWRDLVPCEKGGAAGLYDRVTGSFYGNSGSGSFAVGSEVPCVDGLLVGHSATCFAASGRAMSVTKNYTGGFLSSVRLDFAEAPSSLTYHLYAAFDEQDRGENIDNWSYVRYLDPIAAADMSYTYELPAWWGKICETVRFFLMADAPATTPMPYDKRFEYIKGSNAAYIQTSFYPTGKTRIVMDCVTSENDSNSTAFSVRSSAGSFLSIFNTNGLKLRYDIPTNSDQYSGDVLETGRHMFMFDGSGAFVDGVMKISAKSGKAWPDFDWEDYGLTLSIFALQTGGVVGTTAKGRYQLYSFKAWRDVKSAPETLGLDLVPCEKNGRPGVYDRVSQEFMASAESDDFIAGREIPLSPVVAGVTRSMGFLPDGFLLLVK